MNRTQFADFVSTIRRVWNSRQGILVNLFQKGGLDVRMRLTVGPVTNKDGLVAERCRVWLGDDCPYVGDIDSRELQTLLNEGRVCRAVFTNTAAGGKGLSRCYGMPSARCGACRLKPQHAKYTAV